MKNNETIKREKIESYLPIFPGFYETIFKYDGEEGDVEQEIEDGNLPEEATSDDLKHDYKDYFDRMCKACCVGVEKRLSDEGINLLVEFQALSSPEFYNFGNDSINVAYHVDKENVKAIKEYLEENRENFYQYLQFCYTSVDGFVSSYSNDIDVWMDEYLDKITEETHFIGSILSFILKNEGMNQEDLYFDCSDEHYCSYELIKKA